MRWMIAVVAMLVGCAAPTVRVDEARASIWEPVAAGVYKDGCVLTVCDEGGCCERTQYLCGWEE